MNTLPNNFQGKDIFERMNFLYQASQSVINKNLTLASHYNSLMIGCAKKGVLRVEPDIKRTICKACQSLLVPGKTARVRLVSKSTKAVNWTCLACGSSKKFPTKKVNKLWWDQPEAIRCVFDYTPKPQIECLKSKIKSSKSTSEKEIKIEKDPTEKEKEYIDKHKTSCSS